MTDPLPPPDDLSPDELAVHAVLDGEATPDEQRRVARDPALRARLEEVRRTVATTAVAPEPLDPEVLARLRTTALDELDAIDGEPLAPEGTGPDPGRRDETMPVVPLAPRRAARRLPPLPAVAAVVLVLLAVGVGLVLSDQDGSDQRADTSPTSAGAEGGTDEGVLDSADRQAPERSAEDGAPAGEDAEASASTTGEAGAPTANARIDTYPDDDALRLDLQAVDPASLDPLTSARLIPGSAAGASPTDDEQAAARCGAVLQASDPAIGPVQAAAVAVVDDTALLVLSTPVAATEDSPASTRLTVLEPNGCVPRFAVQRDP